MKDIMTPNKRKSLGNPGSNKTPGSAKKGQFSPAEKTPFKPGSAMKGQKTPKGKSPAKPGSAKKGPQTPKAELTPKPQTPKAELAPKPQTPTTQTPAQSETADPTLTQLPTPKSATKLNGHGTPNSNKKQKSPNAQQKVNSPVVGNKRKSFEKNDGAPSTKKPKLPKFAGTANLDISTDASVQQNPVAKKDFKNKNKKSKQKQAAAPVSAAAPPPAAAKAKSTKKAKQVARALENTSNDDLTPEKLVEVTAKIVEIEALGEKSSQSAKRRLRKLKSLKKMADAKNAPDAGTDAPLTTTSVKSENVSKQRRERRDNKITAQVKQQKAENELWNADSKKGQNIKQNKVVAPKVVQRKVEAMEEDNEESEDESDYDVESTVKVDKITKKMNDDADDSDDNAEEQSDDEEGEEDEVEESEGGEDEAEQGDGEEKRVKPKRKNKKIRNQLLRMDDIVKKDQPRFVLFVGNLPYDVSKPEIQNHFAKASPLKYVRIMKHRETKQPRGFAYIEMNNYEEFCKCMTMHHSMLKGRRLNVQYSQPGKKKGEAQKSEIKKKNFKLHAMRAKGMFGGNIVQNKQRADRRKKQNAAGAE